jgi:hypothetical protein
VIQACRGFIRLWFPTGALLLAFCASAQAQEKVVVTLVPSSDSPSSCASGTKHTLLIYPRKVAVSSSGDAKMTETFEIDESGSYGRIFRNSDGSRFQVNGNVKARRYQITQLKGPPACTWASRY